MADAHRRPPLYTLQFRFRRRQRAGGRRRERNHPARGRRHPDPAPELGLAWLLRRLLSAASVVDRDWSLIDLACSQSLTFGPLRGERDREYQFGVSIPFHGWVLEEDTFQTRATNWLDHSNIGESNIFWPLTWSSRPHSRLGDHLAFAAYLAPRSNPRSLLESDRTGHVAIHRRLDLPNSGTRRM